jgi:large subunit ribosomal protein L15
MKYHELNTVAKPSGRRVGRGIAAGQGKTAGRGTKGQKSRTGYSRRPGFEGGQNPLTQRFPKLRGFRSHRTAPEIIYTGQLDSFGVTISASELAAQGLISSPHVRVKVVVKGEVTKKHTVSLPAASASAVKAIEKAGGSFKAVERLKRPAKTEPATAKQK